MSVVMWSAIGLAAAGVVVGRSVRKRQRRADLVDRLSMAMRELAIAMGEGELIALNGREILLEGDDGVRFGLSTPAVLRIMENPNAGRRIQQLRFLSAQAQASAQRDAPHELMAETDGPRAVTMEGV